MSDPLRFRPVVGSQACFKPRWRAPFARDAVSVPDSHLPMVTSRWTQQQMRGQRDVDLPIRNDAARVPDVRSEFRRADTHVIGALRCATRFGFDGPRQRDAIATDSKWVCATIGRQLSSRERVAFDGQNSNGEHHQGYCSSPEQGSAVHLVDILKPTENTASSNANLNPMRNVIVGRQALWQSRNLLFAGFFRLMR